ncbi:hypothetical protein ACH436_18975 [Isoptericola sp. NPDC019693]|uniref:hypothetical protein n=1 Tax=Isoptericola sp. NPDC019693 TaxID=3364009 RepID=UPI0037B98E8C
MLLAIVRASQADIVGLPGSDGLDEVGPTSASGLTAVWCETLGPLESLGTLLAVDESFDEERGDRTWLRVAVDGTSRVWDWSEVPATDAEVLAATQALCRVLGQPKHPDGLQERLDLAIADQQLVEALDVEFDLPDLVAASVRRAVVVHRGDPADARLAARVAARELGPVDVTELDGRWTVLRTKDPLDADHLMIGLAEGSSRTSVTLGLWRGTGDACGASTVRRFERTEATWGTGWWVPGGSDLEARAAGVQGLAAAVGDVDDPEALRDLVAVLDGDRDPLDALVAALGLPGEAVAVLDARPEAPPLDRVEPASWWRATWDFALSAEFVPDPPRGWRLTGVVAVLVVTLVFLALTAFSVGVLATDGAAGDQEGVSVGDWIFTGVCALLLPFYLGLSVVVIRRFRLDREWAA